MLSIIGRINFDEKGLVPVVVQDDMTSRVLTLCYMNKEALERTLTEKKVYVFRRSKNRVMLKGETSKCWQFVKNVYVDCAFNSLLITVDQTRAACHEGYYSCYFSRVREDGNLAVEGRRVFDPKRIYGKKSE